MTIKAAFDKNISTSESEANSALMELDRGLRSLQNGEQCEAIIKFLQFFDKYPLPIFINSAFLKLTDVYREGSNFMRNLIYIVFQQSQKHIDKILNVDELLKRIFVLSHSNDPIARSITLRLLGSISGIVSERTNVHHFIQNSLESHDKIEVESALVAAEKFCEKSNTFSASICNKIETMIESLSIPLDIKLKIIPLLQYMYRDINLYEKSKNICYNLLDTHPTQEFTLVSLNTLTKLSLNAKIDITKQINLLLSYADSDLRLVVKITCLKDLLLIIKGNQSTDIVLKEEDGNLANMNNFDKLYIGEMDTIGKESSYNSKTFEQLSTEDLSKIMLIYKKSCDALLLEFDSLPNSLVTLLGCQLQLIYSILLKQNEFITNDAKNELKSLSIMMFQKLSTITNLETTKNVMRKYLAKLYLSKLIIKLCTQLYIIFEPDSSYWLFTSLENMLEDSFKLLDYVNSSNNVLNTSNATNTCDKYNCRQSEILKYQIDIYKIVQSTIFNVCRCFEIICTMKNTNDDDIIAQEFFSQIIFTFIQRAFTTLDTIKAKYLIEPCEKIVQIIVILTTSYSKLYKASKHNMKCNNKNSQEVIDSVPNNSNSCLTSVLMLWEKLLLADTAETHPEEWAKLDSTLIVALSKLIFHMKSRCDGTLMLKINCYNCKPGNYWTLYLIAGQAMKRSHHHCAQLILSSIKDKALTPHNFFWLNALYHLALSEAELIALFGMQNSELLFKAFPTLEKSVELHQEALDYLRTASRNFPPNLGHKDYTLPLAFQLKYTESRLRTLKIYREMCGTFISFYLQPVDIFELESSSTMVPHENFIQKLKVAKYRDHMREHESELGQLVQDYEIFGRTMCFDCDPMSGQFIARNNVGRLKILWFAMIKTFAFQQTPLAEQETILDNLSQDTKVLYDDWINCSKNNSHSKQKTENNEFWQPFYELFAGLLKLPNPYPPFYFNSVQNTVIKLAITPQPKYHGASSVITQGNNPPFDASDTTTYVNSNCSSLFNVNVEGLILHLGTKRELFRVVSRLSIRCSYSRINLNGSNSGGEQDLAALYAQIPYMPKPLSDSTFAKEVAPKNDYFSSQFLLEFPAPGFYAINIKCGIIDNDNRHWETGPESILNVKAS